MGIFDKRKSIPRRELKSTFRRHRGTIPGTGGKKYHQQERSEMTTEVFGSKYGSQISKGEYRRAVRDLESAKKGAKTPSEKLKISQKVRYLREMGGKNI